MGTFVKAARRADVLPGKPRRVQVQGLRIALFDVKGTLYAIEDACPHMGGPLSDGDLTGTVVTCPWHAWQFDVCSGVNPDEEEIRVRSYPVKVEGEDVWVEV